VIEFLLENPFARYRFVIANIISAFDEGVILEQGVPFTPAKTEAEVGVDAVALRKIRSGSCFF
jgi:hypothetical protein